MSWFPVGELAGELYFSVAGAMGSETSLTEWVHCSDSAVSCRIDMQSFFAEWLRKQSLGSSFGLSSVGPAETKFVEELIPGAWAQRLQSVVGTAVNSVL